MPKPFLTGGESEIRTHGPSFQKVTRFRVERNRPNSAISPNQYLLIFINFSF